MTEAAFKKPLSTRSTLQHAKGEEKKREMIKIDNLNMGRKDNSTERNKIERAGCLEKLSHAPYK